MRRRAGRWRPARRPATGPISSSKPWFPPVSGSLGQGRLLRNGGMGLATLRAERPGSGTSPHVASTCPPDRPRRLVRDPARPAYSGDLHLAGDPCVASRVQIQSGSNHDCPHCDLAGADLTNTCVKGGNLEERRARRAPGAVPDVHVLRRFQEAPQVPARADLAAGANLAHAKRGRCADFTGADLSRSPRSRAPGSQPCHRPDAGISSTALAAMPTPRRQ